MKGIRTALQAAFTGLALAVSAAASGQSAKSVCDLPEYRGTDAYRRYCGGSPSQPPARGGYGGDSSLQAEQAAREEAARAERARQAQEEARRRAEEAAKQAEFLRDRDAAATTLKGVGPGAAASGLKGLGDTPAAPELKGVAGASASATAPSPLQRKHCPTVTDSRVVDACSVEPWGSNLPKVEDIVRSPAADRARKGLEAVSHHDWKVALAWWQEALKRDPGNAALQRSVDMAKYMVGVYARTKPPSPPFVPVFKALDPSNPAAAAQAVDALSARRPDLKEHTERLRQALLRYERERDSLAPGSINGPNASPLARILTGDLLNKGMAQILMHNQQDADRLLDQSIDIYREEAMRQLFEKERELSRR